MDTLGRVALPQRIGFLLPVGPGDDEVRRARDTLDSVRRYCPDAVVVAIDDDPEPRAEGTLGPAVRMVRTALPKSGWDVYSAMAMGTLTGLGVLADDGVDLAVKLDTDALVVAGFAAAFADVDEDVGVLGRCRVAVDGAPRDVTPIQPSVRRLRSPVRSSEVQGRRRLRLVRPAAWWRTQRALRAAYANGYVTGEHCLGGAYAVTGPALRALRAQGLLDRPLDWVGGNIGEDVLLGVLVRAAGFRPADHPSFGAAWRGLPAAPEEVVARGWSFVHSLKNDEHLDEPEARARFALLRANGPLEGS